MILISSKKILISRCAVGVYLRWWFNGWNYFNFTNGYEIQMKTESMDTQVSQFFSVISKIERSTRNTAEYSYRITTDNISPENISGFTGLLLAEMVEQYEDGVWREVDIVRGEHAIKEAGDNGYSFSFEIKRKELPDSSSVYKKTLKLYVGDLLCDMDDSEIVPINKQVNDIAQMQDRNSDFTASFKIRKTRAMKALFELSGEVGANTEFPYRLQDCKVVQDNIEVITHGILTLIKVDDQYYHVSIISGNASFFKEIESLKITDLTLPSMVHTWDVNTIIDSNSSISPAPDVVYPLCEPSVDGGMTPLTDDGDRVDLYGKWIWAFCKVKTIWDEIFVNAEYNVEGDDVLSSDLFDKLYMPISNLKLGDPTKYMYSVYWSGIRNVVVNELLAFTGATLIKGTDQFAQGYYTCPLTAKYTFTVGIISGGLLFPPALYLTKYFNTLVGTFEVVNTGFIGWTYEVEYEATAGDVLYVVTTPFNYAYYSIAVSKIESAKIAYGSEVDSRLHLPPMTQVDFIKMICNMFGLVPEVNTRTRTVKFWNYRELYENIPLARDWSNYLSERDDEVEFKFGDYAQINKLRYKDSNDVLPDNGMGELPIEDETLKETKDIVSLSVATADEVRILDNIFAVDVARIGFNKWNGSGAKYDPNDQIDPRIVYVDRVRSVASPPYEKTLGIIYTDLIYGDTTVTVDSPLKACTLPISFSNLIVHYAGVSRLLTKTNLRRARFNLPVYEIAGLKHEIPVYLRQYKAYFYVNKINNYVAGKLCTIDLIKL